MTSSPRPCCTLLEPVHVDSVVMPAEVQSQWLSASSVATSSRALIVRDRPFKLDLIFVALVLALVNHLLKRVLFVPRSPPPKHT